MFMNRFLKVISFLSLFFDIIFATVLAGQYKVVRVVYGDQTVIKYNGKYEKVRLLYVDTHNLFVLLKNRPGKRN